VDIEWDGKGIERQWEGKRDDEGICQREWGGDSAGVFSY